MEGLLVKQKPEHEETIDEQKSILEQLKDKKECPVCLEIPRTGPVHVCPNGHFVCKTCKSASCPTCRAPMGTGKSLLAVTVIENIDDKCQFVDCEEVLVLTNLRNMKRVSSIELSSARKRSPAHLHCR